MSSDADSELSVGQPATLNQPADAEASVEAQAPAPVTLDATPDPLPDYLILLLRQNSPLGRYGH